MTGETPEAAAVTALQFDEPAIADELARWCSGEVASPEGPEGGSVTILVPGVHGPTPARLGDWIVREPDGHYRAYTPTDFAARHQPVV